MKAEHMKIAIIEFYQTHNFTDLFTQYLQRLNIEYPVIYLAELSVIHQINWSEYTGVLIRDSGIADDEYRRIFLSSINSKLRIFPSREHILTFETKAQVYLWLELKGYPTLPFYVLPHKFDFAIYSKIHSGFAFANFESFVAKPLRSNGGIGVNIFKSKARLWDFLQSMHYQKNHHWLIQPFIEDAKEFRIHILDQKILSIYKKEQMNSKGNFSQGALGVPISINEFVALTGFDPDSFCREFSSYTAIDYMYSQKLSCGYIVDINLFPGISMLSANEQLNIFNYISGQV
jgi:hypothetical protein